MIIYMCMYIEQLFVVESCEYKLTTGLTDLTFAHTTRKIVIFLLKATYRVHQFMLFLHWRKILISKTQIIHEYWCLSARSLADILVASDASRCKKWFW